MELQRINVKLFTDAAGKVALDPFLDIFARWREDTGPPYRWIDLADYAHVDHGPGVMMIGKQGNLGLDLADPGPGILYANKQGLAGTTEDRLAETFSRCLVLIRKLTAEPEYPRSLTPRTGFWEIAFNDRLETPNTDEIDRRIRPAIETTIEKLLGPNHTLIREADPNRRYGFVIQAEGTPTLEAMASRLHVDSLR